MLHYDAARAHALWATGHYLDAGRLLFEDLPPDRRPIWAAALLSAVYAYAPSTPEIDAVLAVARTPSRWPTGHAVFDAVRRVTLQVSNQDRVHAAVLMVAENTAKVIYNAPQPTDPFDADSGWWLVPNLMDVCAVVHDPQLTAQAWTLLSDQRSL